VSYHDCYWNCGQTDCDAPMYYAEICKYSEAIMLIKLQPYFEGKK